MGSMCLFLEVTDHAIQMNYWHLLQNTVPKIITPFTSREERLAGIPIPIFESDPFKAHGSR